MPSETVAPAPVEATDTDFPVPLARFLPLLVKTPDEVWSRLLQVDHGSEKHTPAEWQALIASYKGA